MPRRTRASPRLAARRSARQSPRLAARQQRGQSAASPRTVPARSRSSPRLAAKRKAAARERGAASAKYPPKLQLDTIEEAEEEEQGGDEAEVGDSDVESEQDAEKESSESNSVEGLDAERKQAILTQSEPTQGEPAQDNATSDDESDSAPEEVTADASRLAAKARASRTQAGRRQMRESGRKRRRELVAGRQETAGRKAKSGSDMGLLDADTLSAAAAALERKGTSSQASDQKDKGVSGFGVRQNKRIKLLPDPDVLGDPSDFDRVLRKQGFRLQVAGSAQKSKREIESLFRIPARARAFTKSHFFGGRVNRQASRVPRGRPGSRSSLSRFVRR